MNLKRLIAGPLAALTLCVGCLMPACAENVTSGTTTFQLAELVPSYTITVPADVTVSRTTGEKTQVDITASDVHLPVNKRISVTIKRLANEKGSLTNGNFYLKLDPKVDGISTIGLGIAFADGTEPNNYKSVLGVELASFEDNGTVPYYVYPQNSKIPDKAVCLPTVMTYGYSVVDIAAADAE